EKIGFKIREAQLQKIPYMIVLGEKEAEAKTLAVRKRRSKETRTINIDTFIEEMNAQVEEKQLGDTVQSI
ncbi:MAG TPA: threonine--tRNA ligase, partial [Nitrospina sp.]|nr:threonine--tRNA ligase [Nitrospina sp.]